MPVERSSLAIASPRSRLYHRITRTASAVAFDQRVVTIEGVPGRDCVTLALEDIDEIMAARGWFGTRLTLRGLSGSAYSVAGLPRHLAADLVAALQREAARLARQVARRCLRCERQIRGALAGERYVRHREGEELRRQVEQMVAAPRASIVRELLGVPRRPALPLYAGRERPRILSRVPRPGRRRLGRGTHPYGEKSTPLWREITAPIAGNQYLMAKHAPQRVPHALRVAVGAVQHTQLRK